MSKYNRRADKFGSLAHNTWAVSEVPIRSKSQEVRNYLSLRRRDGAVCTHPGLPVTGKNVSLPLSVLFAILFFLTGCGIHDNEDCTSSVQFSYSYNEESSTTDNKISYWISTIDEYIFDESHLLSNVRHIDANGFRRQLLLEPGKYSVIAVGNADQRSIVTDSRTGKSPQIGVTHREDLRLSLSDTAQNDDGIVGPCEELFYGYRTFTVTATEVSRIRIDLVNAHFQLRFKVRWQNTDIPKIGTYYAVVEDVPSQYALMPEYVFPAGKFEAESHDPVKHDTHPITSNETIHHIPAAAQANPLSYGNTTYLNADYEVWGQMVHYRVKNDTPLKMNLYYSSSGTRAATDPSVLPRAIDLRECLEYFEYNLDHELKQEYMLDIEVNGEQIIINPIDGLSIADWTDGGRL